jgi:hypothetical protein
MHLLHIQSVICKLGINRYYDITPYQYFCDEKNKTDS